MDFSTLLTKIHGYAIAYSRLGYTYNFFYQSLLCTTIMCLSALLTEIIFLPYVNMYVCMYVCIHVHSLGHLCIKFPLVIQMLYDQLNKFFTYLKSLRIYRFRNIDTRQMVTASRGEPENALACLQVS